MCEVSKRNPPNVDHSKEIRSVEDHSRAHVCPINPETRKARVLTPAGLSVMVNHMVNHESHQLDLAFSALAHPIRRGILQRLAKGDASVAELAKPHDVSAPAISKHMRLLEEAGLVSRLKQGRRHRCRLEEAKLRHAQAWIERYRQCWNERLDALEKYLKEETP
jgi:DNA-binding transcriptional ArsR family regulator